MRVAISEALRVYFDVSLMTPVGLYIAMYTNLASDPMRFISHNISSICFVRDIPILDKLLSQGTLSRRVRIPIPSDMISNNRGLFQVGYEHINFYQFPEVK